MDFRKASLDFLAAQYAPLTGGFSSVPGGPPTLYGTVYATLTRYYLDPRAVPEPLTIDFILSCQESTTGLFKGPELNGWAPADGCLHDLEHITYHLTCATLPALGQFGVQPKHKLKALRKFTCLDHLKSWLSSRDMRDPWLEGNNLLYVAQFLIYLRDQEHVDGAQESLDYWFNWLNDSVDELTGLWGVNLPADRFTAMCGGYHQLLAYYHEHRDVNYAHRLVDTVLRLQHPDGGFCPWGGGGACEDVDAVDILVNMYKTYDYRRAAIRVALRKCLCSILSSQHSDGGFPYKTGVSSDHLGIPATRLKASQSGMFPTWFRIHTIALIAEILTDDARLKNSRFEFSDKFSMGWHRKWDRTLYALTGTDLFAEVVPQMSFQMRRIGFQANRLGRFVKRNRFAVFPRRRRHNS